LELKGNTSETRPGGSGGRRRVLSRLLFIKETAGIIMLVLIVGIFYILSPVFISLDNLRVILRILPELGIVSIGVTLLMIAG